MAYPKLDISILGRGSEHGGRELSGAADGNGDYCTGLALPRLPCVPKYENAIIVPLPRSEVIFCSYKSILVDLRYAKVHRVGPGLSFLQAVYCCLSCIVDFSAFW
jgi:hypothetical protein